MPLLQVEDVPARLQLLMARRGIEVVASLVPAEDESVDDEVVFATPDGSGRYPVAVQLGPDLGYFAVVEYEMDAQGEVVAATHGMEHGSMEDIDVIAGDLASRLKASTPFVAEAPPSPRR